MSQNFTPQFFYIFLNSFYADSLSILFDLKLNFHETTVSQSFKFIIKTWKIRGNTLSRVIQLIRMIYQNIFLLDSQINFLHYIMKHMMIRSFFVFQLEFKWEKI